MNFTEFEKKISVDFKNKSLLKEAFTHRSYVNENPNAGNHNERLEFLGDAVLELVITRQLFEKYPDSNEGDLTSYRAGLVNTGSLSNMAEKLEMNSYILLSKGEEKDTGRARHYILANAYEAVVGAIYLDAGYGAVKEFIAKTLFPYIEEVVEKRLWQDAKSFFQEKAQNEEGITPSYKVLKEEGPDHSKIFTVGVFIGNEMMSQGEGLSKQEAEQSAAQKALNARNWRE